MDWQHLGRALTVRLDFMLVGQSVIERSPDHATVCRFRRLLVLRGLDAVLLSKVNRQPLVVKCQPQNQFQKPKTTCLPAFATAFALICCLLLTTMPL